MAVTSETEPAKRSLDDFLCPSLTVERNSSSGASTCSSDLEPFSVSNEIPFEPPPGDCDRHHSHYSSEVVVDHHLVDSKCSEVGKYYSGG